LLAKAEGTIESAYRKHERLMMNIAKLASRNCAFLFCFTCAIAAEAPKWENKIPPGGETNPIALNIALGRKDIPDRRIVERLRGAYDFWPYAFRGVTPKTTNDGIFRVDIKPGAEGPPYPNMAGMGPFFLLKSGKDYYALSERNLAKLFSPLEKKSEVLPYLAVYQRISGAGRYDEIVTSEFFEGRPLDERRRPPKFTEVTEVPDGFNVTLVTYTRYLREAFFESKIRVGRDGIVKVTEPERVLKELGGGFVY